MGQHAVSQKEPLGSLVGVAITLATIAVLAVLLEGGTRLYYHYESRRFIHPYLGETYKPHHRVSHRTPEGERFEYTLNNYGFRGEDIPDRKPDGASYVVTLGGSTTACNEYPWEKTWPGVMEQRLRTAPGTEQVHVYNAGMAGATSYRSMLVFLNFLTRVPPDLVIVYEAVNDLGPDLPSRARYFRDIGNREQFMHRWSYFLIELARRTQNPLVLKLTGVSDFLYNFARPTPPFRYHEENYRNIAYLARGYRIPVMFMTQPLMPDSAVTRDINSSTLSLGDELNVPVFDLARVMPHDSDYFLPDRVHYTARGNRWIGEHAAGWIIDQRLLLTKDPGNANRLRQHGERP
jgi:lysophospholipase L1-like esterase